MCVCVCVCVCVVFMPSIFREYHPDLEVSGDFPGNSAFRELSNGVLCCEVAVFIQPAMVIPWFGDRLQEAICPVFGNVTCVNVSL